MALQLANEIKEFWATYSLLPSFPSTKIVEDKTVALQQLEIPFPWADEIIDASNALLRIAALWKAYLQSTPGVHMWGARDVLAEGLAAADIGGLLSEEWRAMPVYRAALFDSL